MNLAFFFNIFGGDKKIIIAVNSCLDLYFYGLIIWILFDLRSLEFKRGLLVIQKVGWVGFWKFLYLGKGQMKSSSYVHCGPSVIT